MSGLARPLARGAFALGILATLGFGAQQAVAAPAERLAGPACISQDCDYSCITTGYNYGICVNGKCVCRTGP